MLHAAEQCPYGACALGELVLAGNTPSLKSPLRDYTLRGPAFSPLSQEPGCEHAPHCAGQAGAVLTEHSYQTCYWKNTHVGVGVGV